MSKTVKTPKGTELPLLNLKGKSYLMGAYRVQWMNEEVANYEMKSEFLLLTDEQTVARATVTLLDKDGKVIKSATATKREAKKHFEDHTEKAESSAYFRCLALLGYGTQFALTDLSEGERIVDSPLEDVKSDEDQVSVPKTSSFRPKASKPKTETTQGDEWQ